MALFQKTAKNISLIFITTVFSRTVAFTTKIILARILLPADFGLVALGSLAIESLNLFRNVGVDQALIFKKDRIREAADSAFFLIPLMGTILFILAFILAPLVADFFGEAAVENIVRLLAIGLIINSLGSVPMILFEKELNFRKAVIPQMITPLVYGVSAILLALNGFSFWSLVYGSLLSYIAGLIAIWSITSWRPSFRFNREIGVELFSYGKHILAANIVIFFVGNLDNAFVGKFLGASALGLYAIAYTISNLPATNITTLINRVLFPTYSKMQDDAEKLKKAYLKTLEYTSLLSVPSAFGLFIIAPFFIDVILGSNWMPSLDALRILCLFGLLNSLFAINGEMYKAKGRPDILFKLNFLKISLIIPLFFIFIPYGIEGIATVITGVSVITASINLILLSRLLNIAIRTILRVICPSLFASIIMTLFLAAFQAFSIDTLNLSQLIILISSIILAVPIYFGIMWFLNRRSLLEIRDILVGVLRRE